MLKLCDAEKTVLSKYDIAFDASTKVNDLLEQVEDIMHDIGFDEDDEINDKGRELERVYDSLFYNN